MDYNDINRYREQGLETKRKIESSKIHYTLETEHLDHPDTMDNTAATVLYILVMIGGSIFYDRVLIWIFVTIIYARHMGRHMLDRNKKN